jgi:hypothetical protein
MQRRARQLSSINHMEGTTCTTLDLPWIVMTSTAIRWQAVAYSGTLFAPRLMSFVVPGISMICGLFLLQVLLGMLAAIRFMQAARYT